MLVDGALELQACVPRSPACWTSSVLARHSSGRVDSRSEVWPSGMSEWPFSGRRASSSELAAIILKPRVSWLVEAWAPPLGKSPQRRKHAFKVQLKSPEQTPGQVTAWSGGFCALRTMRGVSGWGSCGCILPSVFGAGVALSRLPSPALWHLPSSSWKPAVDFSRPQPGKLERIQPEWQDHHEVGSHLSFTVSWIFMTLMPIESVMPSTISPSVIPFSCPQPFPASGFFPVSQLFS